ncbi:hypothetical protein CHARACLAT_032091 [Characodon lateralis]|uniref:Uncharacterized protein n=1 Tax=Characodon lateralis TaxID=208331 RepID=A0ABU7CTT3_9TELE|nr:hypothetical protein [Characodon lateralis]
MFINLGLLFEAPLSGALGIVLTFTRLWCRWSVIMKYFEQLVLKYLKEIQLNSNQFYCWTPSSLFTAADDAFNLGLHFILHHLDHPGMCGRILFVEFQLALQHHQPRHILPEAHSALNAGFFISVDHKLPD